jgi:hypothetical protein
LVGTFTSASFGGTAASLGGLKGAACSRVEDPWSPQRGHYFAARIALRNIPRSDREQAGAFWDFYRKSTSREIR